MPGNVHTLIMIELRIQCGTLSGHEILSNGKTQYLGDERIAGCLNADVTEAIRAFNLPTAVAPSEWPNPHEGVTCDADPRR